MHTQVDLPQMKSEAVKQRLQNPAAAAAGGDDQIITNRPQSEVLYIHPFGECVEEDGSYAYAFVFEPVTHTRALLAGCTSTTHVGCKLQPGGFGFLGDLSSFLANCFSENGIIN
jgi:hypothetical protein